MVLSFRLKGVVGGDAVGMVVVDDDDDVDMDMDMVEKGAVVYARGWKRSRGRSGALKHEVEA
jgi:hypothetical protein